MPRRPAIFAMLLLCGPFPQANADMPPESAFKLDAAKRIILLDTRVAPRQRRRFDIGFGSVTLETLAVKDGQLTFRYTPEVEGGYTIYEVSVAVSPTPVTIDISDGTAGATSFDLKKCKVIRP